MPSRKRQPHIPKLLHQTHTMATPNNKNICKVILPASIILLVGTPTCESNCIHAWTIKTPLSSMQHIVIVHLGSVGWVWHLVGTNGSMSNWCYKLRLESWARRVA